jgi:predicted transcriptional regulator
MAEPMRAVIIHLTDEVIAAVESLARAQERTRGAQLRWLICRALAMTDAERKAAEALLTDPMPARGSRGAP